MQHLLWQLNVLVIFASFILVSCYLLSPELMVLKSTLLDSVLGSSLHATSVTTSSLFSFQFMGIWVGSCCSDKRLSAWKPHLLLRQQRTHIYAGPSPLTAQRQSWCLNLALLQVCSFVFGFVWLLFSKTSLVL